MEKTEKINFIYIPKPTYIENQKNNDILGGGKARYYIFDNFKGILIYTVVFAHFLFEYSSSNENSLSRKIVVFIYFFHMQSFIFISGFLSSENSIKINNTIKLLILYYIFNFSFSLIIHFYINATINFIYPQYSYWYILSLFQWRTSIKILNKIDFIFIISIIISILEGYGGFSNVFSLTKTITFFPYFLAGYKIAKINILNKFLLWKNNIIKYFLFLISFSFYLYFVIRYINNNKITNSTLLMNNYNRKSTIKERIIIMFTSFIMIIFCFLLLPDVRIPIISKWGKNSLYIYLFHRIFTIIAYKNFFKKQQNSISIIEFSILFSFIILFVFGSDFCNKYCNYILNYIHKNLIEYNLKGKIIINIFCISFIILLLIRPIKIHFNQKKSYKNFHKKNYSLQIKKSNNFKLKKNLSDLFFDSIRISYVGDLILLKDQILVAKNNLTGKYEFDDMFKYTSKHFHESDFSIGVYEGPSAGNNTSFSTSNYDDKIPLYLNYPDEFAEAVKKAGINLVTTANNHLLDKKIEGAMRTLDVLDKYNLSHVGSYRNLEEKHKIEIFDVKGIKIAILAYTSIMNRYNTDILYKKYRFLTRIIPNKKRNKYYEQIYDEIKDDFIRIKKASPDIIIVLAHMGKEFMHHTNKFQEEWNKIFSNLGADIILGDHSHSVQPLQYIGKTFIVNSPGNFANSYIKKDGDSTALIDIYIHKKTKKVIKASAIPMYTKEIRYKYYSAIPIYDLIKDKSIVLDLNERKRVEEIQLMSTKVLLGKEFGIHEVKDNYFFNSNYFDFNLHEEGKIICKNLKKFRNSKIYKYIENSKSLTFIGDSITEGTKNGFHPWYEPLTTCFDKKTINNISKGGYTTKLIIKKFRKKIINSKSDLYIIALGVNDIRYRKKSICSMDSKEYIIQIEKIVNMAKNRKSKFILISPWFSTPDDKVSKLNHSDKIRMIDDYSLELERYSKRNGYIYVNPNNYLKKKIREEKNKYLVDFIHPNSNLGIQLYCEGVLTG